ALLHVYLTLDGEHVAVPVDDVPDDNVRVAFGGYDVVPEIPKVLDILRVPRMVFHPDRAVLDRVRDARRHTGFGAGGQMVGRGVLPTLGLYRRIGMVCRGRRLLSGRRRIGMVGDGRRLAALVGRYRLTAFVSRYRLT